MFIVQFVIFIVCFVPLSLIIHELGHIVGARLNKATNIKLTIGTGRIIFQKSCYYIKIVVRLILFIGISTASHRTVRFSHNEKFFIALLGPVFSLLFALLLCLLYIFYINYDSLQLAYLFNFWLFIINMIPFRVGQKQSDGYTMYRMIKKNTKSNR